MNLSLSNSKYESISVNNGDILFKKGEEASAFYILEFGHIAVFNMSDNKRIIPMFSKKDTGVVGEDSVLQSEPTYNYYAVALQPSNLIKIPAADIHMFLSSSADWVENILFELSGRVKNTLELLIQHNIADDRLNYNSSFSDEEISQLRAAIKD